MMVISKIIYIMKGMFVLRGKPVGLGGKLQYFCFSLPQGAVYQITILSLQISKKQTNIFFTFNPKNLFPVLNFPVFDLYAP